MVPVRLAIWIVLSACTFAVALVLIALTRSVSAVDHGWLNALMILAAWAGVAAVLKRFIVADLGQDSVSARHHLPSATLQPLRR